MAPHPKAVLDALKKCDERAPHYFWNGNCTLKTQTTIWQMRLKELFTIAGVEKGHARRFRDTFSTALLMQGVSIENVAALLGNTPATVQEHYAPWAKGRQEKLEELVKRTWTK